ncbi:hypothetical protein ACQ4M3_10540 [Leptolyngbya sp. AN03gr2]|uniref:hypothetical protein n=1 Tax=unclassified Leptolyngbya TaxID=2650499 RepID=UPI003D313974
MTWKNWGDHPVVVAVSVLAGLAGMIALGYTILAPSNTQSSTQQVTKSNATPNINAPNSNVQVGNNNSITNNTTNNNTTINHTNSGFPSPPPDIAAPALTAQELFSSEFGTASGCYPEGNSHIMTLVEAGQDDLYSGSEPPHFYLIDEKGVQVKIYLDKDIANVTASWIPVIMVPGRRLKIEYAQCGSAAIKQFTYIEALTAIAR